MKKILSTIALAVLVANTPYAMASQIQDIIQIEFGRCFVFDNMENASYYSNLVANSSPDEVPSPEDSQAQVFNIFAEPVVSKNDFEIKNAGFILYEIDLYVVNHIKILSNVRFEKISPDVDAPSNYRVISESGFEDDPIKPVFNVSLHDIQPQEFGTHGYAAVCLNSTYRMKQ